ncbi:alpha/beta hydrolase [Paenibacillus etheri]|nr:alpha/beta hydrolase-fold protein [Paenibacillus etheri]
MSTQVELEHTESWKLESQYMGYSYDIKVSLPREEAPANGFPVYYMLDGNSYFQLGRDVVKLQSRNAPKTLIAPGIVIGIGHYGTDEEVSKRRFFDFTPPAKQYVYPDRLKNADIGPHGGAEKFQSFLELELMPLVSEKYNVDQQKQVLFGHSLSGLFVLWTLFTRAELFQYYLASSPSIWWNDHEILVYAEQFYNKGQAIRYDKRKLLITVGSEEAFMVDDAKVLFSKLSEHSLPDLQVEHYIAPDENHASVVPTIMSRAFRMLNR